MVEKNNEGLIFIYNADSGAINLIKDFFHKMIKPNTYECNLCSITFGNFGMKKDWAKFIKELEEDISIDFLHRDEFEKYYPKINDAKYPSAYYKEGDSLEIFISQEEMNSLKSIEELEDIVNNRLKNRD
jgi:hypothetical protein